MVIINLIMLLLGVMVAITINQVIMIVTILTGKVITVGVINNSQKFERRYFRQFLNMNEYNWN